MVFDSTDHVCHAWCIRIYFAQFLSHPLRTIIRLRCVRRNFEFDAQLDLMVYDTQLA